MNPEVDLVDSPDDLAGSEAEAGEPEAEPRPALSHLLGSPRLKALQRSCKVEEGGKGGCPDGCVGQPVGQHEQPSADREG